MEVLLQNRPIQVEDTSAMIIGRAFGQGSLRGVCLFVLIWCLFGYPVCQGAALQVYDLKCDYQTDPLGIDTLQPCLSWKLNSAERGQSQTAYQIIAASTLAKLKKGEGDLWNSGKVDSSQSIGVPYGGVSLHSGERVYWNVRAWDQKGKPYDCRQSAWWEMGLLDPEDWRAAWIMRPRSEPPTGQTMFDNDPAPLFRKEFDLGRTVARARIRVSGLGYYEVYLNGRRVGDHMLDPGWTTYSKRVLYSTYDVTSQVKRGRNAIGVMLGNGWFNPLPLLMWGSLNLREHLTVDEPRVCLQLVVDFASGDSETIGTDDSWKVGSGPILRNSVYLGEVYDARKEQPGWDRAGFDDSRWQQAVPANKPVGPLRVQDAPPIRITRILKPVKLSEPKPGVYIFDFGQNYAGWIRLHVQGPAGTEVKMRYGELLQPNGRLNGLTSVCGQIKEGGAAYRYNGTGAPKTAWQMDEYILKGLGQETYCPRFTFHGFRYVEITGLPQRPALGDIEGLRLNSDVTPAGSFTCSNEEFNRIQEMVLWTELSNLFSVESDCPHREKFGYGGDMVAASEAAIFNFDMERFYAKAVQDLDDAVRTNGGFTETAPFVGISDEGLGGGSGPVGWGTAQPFLQWELYQYYGDLNLLAAQYPVTKRWIDFLQTCASDDLLDNGISDHESLEPKPRALTGTAFYYYNVRLFAKIARALGKEPDATEADALSEKIKAAFNRKFLKPGSGIYDTGTQACQAFAFYMKLVPREEQPRALEVLAHDIVDVHKGHLTTGIFGTKYMLNALSDFGRSDLAYEIVNQRTFPGWGYMLENGATTLWEHWELSDNTYSHNHPMFGSVSEWFYKGLGGINPAPDAVAFDKILIKPRLVAGLNWVKSSYDSVRGKIVSDWKSEGDKFKLRVRVPVGASATVFLPAKAESSIMEGAKPLEQAKCVHLMRMEKSQAIITIVSGEYEFTSVLPYLGTP
jgi:alpha-L-rhamnosidase